jgi:hypothetical protein
MNSHGFFESCGNRRLTTEIAPMSPEQMYQQLVELAEKLQIQVSEKNLRQAGLRVRSGLCKVHDEWIYVMDKKTRLSKKISLLAECLGRYPLDAFYLVPAVREVIDRNRSEKEESPQRSIDEDDAAPQSGAGQPEADTSDAGLSDPDPS